MSVKITEKTISQGANRWRVTETGEWSVLMFGSFPNSNGLQWRWVLIDSSKVPKEVKDLA
jgi:hypothetical protein